MALMKSSNFLYFLEARYVFFLCILFFFCCQSTIIVGNWDTFSFILLFHQNGRGVFKDVCPLVASLISEQLGKNNISPEEISKFWLHQANGKMIRLITSKILGTDDFDENITPMPITEFGNLASVGSLFAFNLNNDLTKGQKGVICSFGAGYSVCSIIVEKN